MSSITRTELEHSLTAGKVQPLYLLIGCEGYLRDKAAQRIADVALADTLLREFNESAFSMLTDHPVSAVSAAEQLPMMSDRRVVKIRDFGKLREADEGPLISYLDRPVDSTVVIFVAESLDKRKTLTKSLLSKCTVVEFAAVKDSEAKSWAKGRLKELKTAADDRVLSDIVHLVGCSLQTLNSELEKLASAAADSGRITSDLVDDLIGRSRELSNFDLGDQLVAGDRRRALETLHRLLDDKVEPVMLVGLIASNYRRLALAKEFDQRGNRDEVNRLIYGPPSKRDAFMRTLQRSDAKKIARGIQLIAATDLAIKTSQGGGGPKGARLQLEILVCELAA